jgi:hypothetical protein
MSYAILRTKKLKSASQIARVGRHNEREQRTLNADSERTKLNVDYRSELTGSLIDRVRRRIGNRQHRKDAVLAVEVLMAYSPEEQDSIDPLGWGIASMDWLESEFGRNNIVSARLHRDEKSVHAQCCVVPLDPNGRLNCKHFLGGPRKLAALQTRYAAAVAHFGLKRGEEGSKRRHVPIRDLYRDSNLLKDEAEKAAALIEMLQDPPRLNVPERRTLESHREHEKRIDGFVREMLLRIWQQLQDALVRLVEAGRNVGLLKAERSARVAAMKRSREAEKRAAIAERRVAKAERMVADQGKRIADLETHLADRCRELPLARIAQDLLKAEPKKTQADLLFVTSRHRLVIRGNRFELKDACDPRRVLKGKNAIDLICGVMHCKFSRAVEYLASRYETQSVCATAAVRAEEKAATLSRSPLAFSRDELWNALQMPDPIRRPATPPLR